jgi:hypothetical protein
MQIDRPSLPYHKDVFSARKPHLFNAYERLTKIVGLRAVPDSDYIINHGADGKEANRASESLNRLDNYAILV